MNNYGNQNNWNQNNNWNPSNWNNNQGGAHTAPSAAVTSVKAKAFLSQVMGWMFGALLLTAAVSWGFANIPALQNLIYTIDPATGSIIGMKILGWVVMFLPLVLGMVMTFAFEKLSFGVLVLLFCGYATAIGMSLSVIALAYAGAVIAKAFLITAGVFGVMAFAGWVTKADLSRLGTILMIGFIGVVIAMLVNAFIGSSGFAFIIDIACVVIFTGLIAYKVQQVKLVGEQVGTSQPKFAVIEALGLYITFINLFLTILRLLGRRE
ncbi:MAG: Bax inhibitor-1/YccA family protein [Bacteroidia bacterium]|jgi:hypothetical protein|nr:Bax inhibitor-1/YccA family protein [Bacteroidia bacterium]